MFDLVYAVALPTDGGMLFAEAQDAVKNAMVWTLSAYIKEIGDYGYANLKKGYNYLRKYHNSNNLEYSTNSVISSNVPTAKDSISSIALHDAAEEKRTSNLV